MHNDEPRFKLEPINLFCSKRPKKCRAPKAGAKDKKDNGLGRKLITWYYCCNESVLRQMRLRNLHTPDPFGL